MTRSSELLRGTLDLLILHALDNGISTGNEISDWLHVQSGAVIKVSSGSLYPALHRLERRGLIAGRWQQSELMRRAKAYALTPAGRADIARELPNWTNFVVAAAAVFGVEPNAPEWNASASHKSLPLHATRESKLTASRRRDRARH